MAKKTKETEATAQETPVEVAESKPKETTIYIGKSIPGLPQYTVFKNGVLPAYIAEIAANDEAVKGLIVPVSELQEARKNARIKGHILNTYINKQKQGV